MTFQVGRSRIRGAGEGLFTTRKVAAGELFRVEHSRRRGVPMCAPDKESLSFSVSDDVEASAPCCFMGRPTTYAALGAPSTPAAWVHARREYILMKANDLAWPAPDEVEYNRQSVRNAMELVLDFDRARRPVGVMALMNRDVAPGEEVGVTYGYGYWVHA